MNSESFASLNDQDRTARARIRDAALVRFAQDGVAQTSMKTIAADAGVSPPLVAHHFGSKAGLQRACDEYVAAMLRHQKRQRLSEMTQPSGMDPLQTLREVTNSSVLIRYLARTLAEGSEHVDALVDELAEDAVAYTEESVESGLVKPSNHPRERVIILTLWSLGALTMHEHLTRLLGVDLTSAEEDLTAYLLPATEILTNGIFTTDLYGQLLEALNRTEEEGS